MYVSVVLALPSVLGEWSVAHVLWLPFIMKAKPSVYTADQANNAHLLAMPRGVASSISIIMLVVKARLNPLFVLPEQSSTMC